MRSDIFHAGAQNSKFQKGSLFDEFGDICGNSDKINTELSLKLGIACAGEFPRICVGVSDCTMSKLLAGAFISGAASAGAQITELGASFFAASAYIARTYLFNLMVFFENDGCRLCIRITDKFGLTLERALRDEIEAKVNAQNLQVAGISDVILPKAISESTEIFTSSLVSQGKLDGVSVSVSGSSAATDALLKTLSLSGCEIVNPQKGICDLSVSADGMHLFFCDENEYLHDASHVVAACTHIFFESGAKEIATFPDSPGVLDQIASEHGGRVLRIGRDAGARELFLSQNVLTNAISNAVLILSHLSEKKISAAHLFASLPDFTLISREIGVKNDRRRLIDTIEAACSDMYREHIGPLRVCADGGWVNISSARSGSSLRITGEGSNEEIASELCNLFIERASYTDTELSK